jgi:signal peptidase I
LEPKRGGRKTKEPKSGTKPGRSGKERRKTPWWELPALIGLAVIIAVIVKSFVVQPFYIPSPSMEKTLHGCTGCSGDRILVNKPIYDFRNPEPGDIVVFNAPKGWDDGEPVSQPPSDPVLRAVRDFGQLIGFVPPDGLVLVKRVIAVGGQTVKGLAGANGKDVVEVSDHGDAGPWKTLSEPFVYIDPGQVDANAAFGPVTVPKGRHWVLGDHRNDSADSRYHCGANATIATNLDNCDPLSSTVPVGNVIGKAFVIAWPPSRWRTLGTPSTFSGAVVLPLFFLRRRRRRKS